MAVRHLLWCCPHCAAFASLEKASARWERCRDCGARYRRVQGARIEARPGDGGDPVVRSASEWADLLPAIETSFREPAGTLAEARVRARFQTALTPVHFSNAYLGRVEKFGKTQPGTLRLTSESIVFAADNGKTERWQLDELTAVQASSSTLQIKSRSRPVGSFRFPEASARYWEESLRAALRARYRAQGRGEVVEFQPRIMAR